MKKKHNYLVHSPPQKLSSWHQFNFLKDFLMNYHQTAHTQTLKYGTFKWKNIHICCRKKSNDFLRGKKSVYISPQIIPVPLFILTQIFLEFSIYLEELTTHSRLQFWSQSIQTKKQIYTYKKLPPRKPSFYPKCHTKVSHSWNSFTEWLN